MRVFHSPNILPKEDALKVLIINANPSKSFGVPHDLFALCACTPEWIDLYVIDDDVTSFDIVSDILVIIADDMNKYETAHRFEAKCKVIATTKLVHIDLIFKYCDSVLLREYENSWHNLIVDFLNGELKPVYQSKKLVDFSTIKPYRDFISVDHYDYTWGVLVSRGCDEKSFRKRPIQKIVNEIISCQTDFIELKADDFLVDKPYIFSLLEAIKPLNIIWFAYVMQSFFEDDHLIDQAIKSGLRYVGITVYDMSESLYQIVDKLHHNDVEVDVFVLKDSNSDTIDVSEKLLEIDHIYEYDMATNQIYPVYEYWPERPFKWKRRWGNYQDSIYINQKDS